MIFEVENYASLRSELERFCQFLESRNVAKERVFDSRLVACELVGNVLKHAKEKATFCVEVKNGFVELCVYAQTPFVPPKNSRNAELYEEHGRGLFLVNELCRGQITAEEDGIVVYMDIE